MTKQFLTLLLITICSPGLFAQSTLIDSGKYYDFVEVTPLYKNDMNMRQLAPDIMSKMKRSCPIPADTNKILMHFIVETDGSVQYAVIMRGICEDMNRQAIEAVRKLKFTPGSHAGQKVSVKGVVMLKFGK